MSLNCMDAGFPPPPNVAHWVNLLFLLLTINLPVFPGFSRADGNLDFKNKLESEKMLELVSVSLPWVSLVPPWGLHSSFQ